MPIDIGRKQTIEEITNGRIKKQAKEAVPAAGRAGGAGKPEPARKGTRGRK